MMEFTALFCTAFAVMVGGIWLAWSQVKTMKSALQEGWRALQEGWRTVQMEWQSMKASMQRPGVEPSQIIAAVDSCLEARYETVKQQVQAEWAVTKKQLQERSGNFMWKVESRLEQATKKLGYMETRLMEADFSGVEVGRQVKSAMMEFTYGAGKGGIYWWKRQLVEIQASWARGAQKADLLPLLT